jgi:hypothetical protein
MDLMRADMGGAATICSAIVSAAKLNLPINIIGKEGRVASRSASESSRKVEPKHPTVSYLLRRNFEVASHQAAADWLKEAFSVLG